MRQGDEKFYGLKWTAVAPSLEHWPE